MKNYSFTIRGNNYEVEIIDIEQNIAKIDVNGTVYTVDIHHNVQETKTPTIVRAKTLPSSDTSVKTRKPDASKGAGTIKAPLPGTIMELMVKVGDTVKGLENL